MGSIFRAPPTQEPNSTTADGDELRTQRLSEDACQSLLSHNVRRLGGGTDRGLVPDSVLHCRNFELPHLISQQADPVVETIKL